MLSASSAPALLELSSGLLESQLAAAAVVAALQSPLQYLVQGRLAAPSTSQAAFQAAQSQADSAPATERANTAVRITMDRQLGKLDGSS